VRKKKGKVDKEEERVPITPGPKLLLPSERVKPEWQLRGVKARPKTTTCERVQRNVKPLSYLLT
jgi:hypothetical protein